MFQPSTSPSRRDSVRRPLQMDVLPCENACTRHLHVIPPLSAERPTHVSPEIESWLEQIETNYPLSQLPIEARMAPTSRLYEVPKDVKVGDGSLLLRIGKSKMGWEDRNYQVIVKLGENSVLSCPTGKSGCLQDYFLLNLQKLPNLKDVTIDIFVCPLENAIEQRINAKMKSLRDRASEIFKINRSYPKTEAIHDDPMISIPITTLFHHPSKHISGCYFVTANSLPGGTVFGEISLSIIASSNAFVYPQDDNKTFQNYLTIMHSSHCWQRFWALINGHQLYFHRFRQHEIPSGDKIDLTKVISINFHKTHECGLDNIVRVLFDDQSELLAYADDEKQGYEWTNVIHRAVWNQPYAPVMFFTLKSLKVIKGVVIAGPTGIGKTGLAVEIAKRLNGELISCDSVQVYRGLNIGANKTPTHVPQHLIDIVDWKQPFTAADFLLHCKACIKDVVGRGKLPILVGGTGFYLDWIIDGRPGAPPSDPIIMAELEEELKGISWSEAYSRLIQVDPNYAKVLMKNDFYRLKRALVVYRMTNQPLSSFKKVTVIDRDDEIDWCCLYLNHLNRLELLRHLDQRCEIMIMKGLVDEVISLQRLGFGVDCQAGRAIGYQETLEFLKAIRTCSGEDQDKVFVQYIKEFQSQTRQYTRRQEKWFRTKSQFRHIERESLATDISQSVIDQAIALYDLGREAFDDSSNEIVQKCLRLKDVWESEDNIRRKTKELRTFQSRLTVLDSIERRKNIIENIIRKIKE